MNYKTRLSIAFLPLLLTACGEPPDTHPGQPVTQRRAAFSKILKPFEAMGMQLRKDKFKAREFLELSKQFTAAKEGPWSFFGPDTNYPPTHATPAVWKEPERFEKNRQAFLQAAENLQAAAESQEEKRIRQAYEQTHDTCRACHKVFKD